MAATRPTTMPRISFLFLLAAGWAAGASAGSIEGQVVDGAALAPLANARVSVNYRLGGLIPSELLAATTDEQGRYRIDLPAAFTGDVVLIARAAEHAAVTQAGEPCHAMLDCFDQATALPVGPASALSADFRLPPQARISGRMTDLQTGLGLTGELTLTPVGATPAFLGAAVSTNPAGGFSFDQLHAGSYRLTARVPATGSEPASAYFRSVWPAEYCDDLQLRCDTAQFLPISVSYGQQTGDHNLLMRKGGFVLARLRSVGSGHPVPMQAVAAKASQLDQRLTVPSGADGYARIGPLLPGSIKLLLATSPESFPSVVYPNLPCDPPACDLALGDAVDLPFEPVTITLPDISVQSRRSIRGRVTDQNGQPQAEFIVAAGNVTAPQLFGGWGFQPSATTTTDGNGNYVLEGFSGAATMVRTMPSDSRDYVHRAWQQTECTAQNLFCEHEGMSYDRLSFDTEPHPQGIDFALRHSVPLGGRVLDSNGLPLAGHAVAVIPADPARLSKPVFVNPHGTFWFYNLTPGDYYLYAAPFVAATNNRGVVYPDVPCNVGPVTTSPPCDLSKATRFTLAAGGGINDVDFYIPPPDRLFADGFD